MSLYGDFRKNYYSHFFGINSALFAVLPALCIIAVLLLFGAIGNNMIYYKWYQVNLTGTGTIYIPKDWSFDNLEEGLVDAYIFGSNTDRDANKRDEDLLFICYTIADYEQAKQDQAVDGNLDAVISASSVRTSGLYNGVWWSELEYFNSETGKWERYYTITTYRNNGYTMISTADSVEFITVLKIVYSLLLYDYHDVESNPKFRGE